MPIMFNWPFHQGKRAVRPVLAAEGTFRVLGQGCRGCGEVTRGSLPADAPRGQMGPALQAHVGVLAGQYHLSVRKIGAYANPRLNWVIPPHCG